MRDARGRSQIALAGGDDALGYAAFLGKGVQQVYVVPETGRFRLVHLRRTQEDFAHVIHGALRRQGRQILFDGAGFCAVAHGELVAGGEFLVQRQHEPQDFAPFGRQGQRTGDELLVQMAEHDLRGFAHQLHVLDPLLWGQFAAIEFQ